LLKAGVRTGVKFVSRRGKDLGWARQRVPCKKKKTGDFLLN